jgi:uncharacterized protein
MSGLSLHVGHVVDTPQRFQLECDPGWWDRAREYLRELEVGLHRPFRLDLEGYRVGARLLFRGQLVGAVAADCGACLERFVHEFQEPVQLLLEPAPAGARLPEGGIELDPEDIEVGRYEGEELDFEPLVMEILALAWPLQPRCQENCLGLCPVCGVNRNRESCSCAARERSHPFSGLRELLERSGRREG